MSAYTFGFFVQEVLKLLKQNWSWSGPWLLGSIEFEDRGKELLNIIFSCYNTDTSLEDTADKVSKYLKTQI